jgi:hypothetical protein
MVRPCTSTTQTQSLTAPIAKNSPQSVPSARRLVLLHSSLRLADFDRLSRIVEIHNAGTIDQESVDRG